MGAMMRLYNRIYDMVVGVAEHLDGVASLAMRLYLAPVLIAAGWHKLHGDNWFSFALDSFPFPFNVLPPDLSWLMASWTEFLGGVLLLFGIATRWLAVPLMVTMWVAAYSVHWDNGWAAVAPSNPSQVCIAGSDAANNAGTFEKFIECYNVNERTIAASERLARAKTILEENGNPRYLNEYGSFVKLNAGIEFAATYFVMLLALLVIGGGRYFSIDYWLARMFR